MGYPVAYRKASPQSAFRPPSVPRASGTVVPFPRAYQPHFRFGPPTALPTRPHFGLRPPAIPARPIGLPRLALGWFALIPLGIMVAEWALNPNGRMMPVQVSPTGGCGPFAYPGPPYRNEVHWRYASIGGAPCFAPSGGQALSPSVRDGAPGIADNAILWYYGPNESLLPVERYYLYEDARWPTHPDLIANGNLAQRNLQLGRAPVIIPTGGEDPMFAPLANPWLEPIPVRFTPSLTPGVGPYGPERGDARGPQHAKDPRGAIDLAPERGGYDDPRRNTVNFVSSPNAPRDRPPRRNEKEKKLNGNSAAAKGVYLGAKALAAWGDAHGIVNSLYYALPKDVRGRRGTIGTRMASVWTNFDQINWGTAATNFITWKAYERANAWAEGRAREQLDRLSDDPNEGLFRGLQHANRRTGESFFEHQRGRNRDNPPGRKRVNSKRGAQRRHRQRRKARRIRR